MMMMMMNMSIGVSEVGTRRGLAHPGSISTVIVTVHRSAVTVLGLSWEQTGDVLVVIS